MIELLQEAVKGANIIPTFLLVFVLMYGMIAFMGLIDFDTIDFDLDVDADADIDMDADVDADAEGGLSGVSGFLSYFNIGRMPIMIYLFFVVFPMWVMSILINHLLGIESFWLGLILLLPIIFVSLFFAKYACIPVAKLWEGLDGTIDTNFEGKTCTVLYDAKGDLLSQAEMEWAGDKVRLNVKALQGKHISEGDQAVIIEHVEDQDFYYVETLHLNV
ncbi:OB-fold-containig protein [Aureibacter tunicatorum]|uniref:DUF1449 family protein n=1 Tax=Aureibacter tunicatorum TaxID=866807 RepID=A0AAE3XJP6_9BACT|nr:OB-fold-containig protein [Aureibacter tunicatorum]MDR6239001.1 hypothetical protein [Aureibacter tunicatorum]BDD05073.1 hypothetical protein AUTU_25560 [Aureibacter tunicatorum]